MKNNEFSVTMLKKEVEVYKASPFGDEHVPDVKICATETIPDVKNTNNLEEIENIYWQNAKDIYKVFKYLPQGTVSRLLILLLEGKACYLRVGNSWEVDKGKKEGEK